jgi:hypothetical protein
MDEASSGLHAMTTPENGLLDVACPYLNHDGSGGARGIQVVSWSVTSGTAQVSEPERGRNQIRGCCAEPQGLGGSRAALGADPVPQDNSYCSAAVNLCAIAPEGLIRDVYSKKNYATNEEIPALQIIFLHANMLARYGGVTRSVIVATLREAHHIL